MKRTFELAPEDQERGFFDRQRSLWVLRVSLGDALAVSGPGALLTATLGSCVAVCLYDGIHKVGGMTHFLLAHPTREVEVPGNYGVSAVPTLIARLRSVGGVLDGCWAKLFGGADPHGQEGVDFAQRALAEYSIPVEASQVGGDQGRVLEFWPDTGRLRVKPV